MYFMSSSTIVLLPVESIVPNIKQPRKHFDASELESLSQSILENGLLQPITVRPLNSSDFEIISGERRYRACIMAGITRIPSIVIDGSDERSAVLSLAENVQSQKLHFFEEANAIDSLMKTYSYNIDYVSSIIGKPSSVVTEELKLLALPVDLQKRIIDNNLTKSHAESLLKLSEKREISEVLNIIISKKLNVAQTDEFINQLLEQKTNSKIKKRRMFFKDIKLFVNTLDHAVETMNNSGINAQKEQLETDSYIKYTVTISKTVHSI